MSDKPKLTRDTLRGPLISGVKRKRSRRKEHIRVLKVPAKFRESLLRDMTRAYKGRLYKGVPIENPYLHAKWILDRAIRGVDAHGKPWTNVPNNQDIDDIELLRRRLRVLRYDMDKGEVIGWKTGKDGQEPGDVQEVVKQLLPGPNKDSVERTLTYGSDINTLLTEEEEKKYKRFIRDVLKEFPQLDTVSDRPQVEMLALLKIRMDRTKAELAINPERRVGKEAEEISKLYRETLESLGISGKQRKAAQETERQGTIAELALRYERTMRDFPTLYQEWLLDELKMLLQAYERGDIGDWVIRYWAGNIVEAGTGKIVPLDVPKIREILASAGIVPAKPVKDEVEARLERMEAEATGEATDGSADAWQESD